LPHGLSRLLRENKPEGDYVMTIGEYYNRKIPEYYPTMYLDGYTPQEILIAAHKRMLNEYQDSQQVNEIKITSEVKVK
jgi:hypothetical protein